MGSSTTKINFSETKVTSNFTFLEGGSHPEEFILTASKLGYEAISITDRHTFSGIVRAHKASKDSGIQFIVGTEIQVAFPKNPQKFQTLLLYPTNRASYGNVCSLLTKGNFKGEKKEECIITLEDFFEYEKNLVVTIVPDSANILLLEEFLPLLIDGISERQFLSIAFKRNYNSSKQSNVPQIAKQFNIPLLATNDPLYHTPQRKPLQDVLTCIREHTTIHEAGFYLTKNAERYLKSPQETARLFKDFPEAITRTIQISEMTSGFSLNELKYEYPFEICPPDLTPHQYLLKLVKEGAQEKYPSGIPEKVIGSIHNELSIIKELNYEKYFLTCYDIVRFARSRGILCQGRGAAANSTVCFCLGITAVDPDQIDLLFARFVSKERNEPPDIDIDFEHERREEVIQYIYEKYGRHRAGLTCEVVTYRYRSAVREVGKALGLPLDVVDKIAKSIHRWNDCELTEEDLKEVGVSFKDKTVLNTLLLSRELLGFPRHLSQHVGGFIISLAPLSRTVPILKASMPNRTIIEWDKDDIETLGMLKIDVLGLGMLSCIRKALDIINTRLKDENKLPISLHSIPAEDPKVYDMACKADTIGVFQIESRAQMSMLPRLKPRCFYDLVIEVALVRPGPMQGNMVHPFLKRRAGIEKVYFPDKKVQEILGKTLGVPIFQEQAMRLVIVLAEFSPGEAEMFRRAMGAWKQNSKIIATFKERIIKGMLKNGYSIEYAETCMGQLMGFSEYGFPESHAASFALLVYASAWMKCHYHAEFACALLNSQPMGFYYPSQIIQDARSHGILVRPIDINNSSYDCTIERIFPGDEEYQSFSDKSYALRLGLRLVSGLKEADAHTIEQVVKRKGPFGSILELWKVLEENNLHIFKSSLAALSKADAFSSMKLTPRESLWTIKALPDLVLPFDNIFKEKNKNIELPKQTKQDLMFQDYRATGFSLRAHPLSFARKTLNSWGVKTYKELKTFKINSKETVRVSAAGIAIVKQRPWTAKGVVFVTLEDETGILNLIICPEIYEKYQKIIVSSVSILARGLLETTGETIYIKVEHLESIDCLTLSSNSNQIPYTSYSY